MCVGKGEEKALKPIPKRVPPCIQVPPKFLITYYYKGDDQTAMEDSLKVLTVGVNDISPKPEQDSKEEISAGEYNINMTNLKYCKYFYKLRRFLGQ